MKLFSGTQSSPSNLRCTIKTLETEIVGDEGISTVSCCVSVRSQLVFVQSRPDADLEREGEGIEGEGCREQLLCGDNSGHVRVVHGVIGQAAQLNKEK